MTTSETRRPQNFREIFGRALALYVAYPRTFLIIGAIVLAPSAIAEAFGNRHSLEHLFPLRELFTRPSPPPNIFDQLRGLLNLLVAPIAVGVIAAIVEQVEQRRTVDLWDALRRSLQRWRSFVGVDIIFVGLGAIAIVVIAIVVLAIGFLLVRSHLISPHMLAPIIVGMVMVSMIGIAFGFSALRSSYVAATIETKNPIDASRRGFALTWSRPIFARTLLFALTVFLVSLPIGLAGIAITLLAQNELHIYPVTVAISYLVAVVPFGFFEPLVVLYFLDARVRVGQQSSPISKS